MVQYGLGAMFIVAAIVTSGMLVLSFIRGIDLPGCGVGRGCADLTNGKWGKIGTWPVSHVGFAYFLGLLPAWLMSRNGVPSALRWIIRLGALGSLFFIAIMLVEQSFCLYCALTHGANLGLLVVMEVMSRPAVTGAAGAKRNPVPSLGAMAGLFVVTSAALAFFGAAAEKEALEKDKEKLAADTEAMIRPGDADELSTTLTGSTERRAAEMWGPNGFTGRWRQGPADAPIRIVVYSDFQCEDCKAIDKQIRQIALTRNDVSISHKHFAFCPDCNRHISVNMHPNACWASRAAETAGIIKGNRGFWDMHAWLFDRGGAFESWENDLRPGLMELGYTPEEMQEFVAILNDESRTLPQIEKEIDEAVALGLYYTPMIFINGVQLRGWRSPNAVIQAVNAVAASNPKPMLPLMDNPPLAPTKYVGDWEASPWLNLPRDEFTYPLGVGSDEVEIVVWGDYREPGTQKFDRHMRQDVLPNNTNVMYVFRHYPLDETCNPRAKRALHPDACKAHQLAETVAQMGGLKAYTAMHAWLMDNPDDLTDDAKVRLQIERIGLSVEAVYSMMSSTDVQRAIDEDTSGAEFTQLRKIPWIYVNGRFVDRWFLEGEPVMQMIIDRAREIPKTPGRRVN
jgi:protein-disulfide isomerase/uncharacterized membrane protein